jgi:hypothetical protein
MLIFGLETLVECVQCTGDWQQAVQLQSCPPSTAYWKPGASSRQHTDRTAAPGD